MANPDEHESTDNGHEDSIWEFVACAICYLPFSTDGVAPPQVPFWLTECGHILCNSHLSADQSCSKCRAQNIELMPLSRDVPQPMADWFCSMPHKLDGIAQATKFQQETLCALVRFYKNKCIQQRNLIEQVRKEANALKTMARELEQLRHENEVLRGVRVDRTQYQHCSDPLNSNGKRMRVEYGTSNSSPRSITTSKGPQRLTLPPGYHPPPAPVQKNASTSSSRHPGTAAFARQYAFNPTDAPRPAAQTVTSNHSHQQGTRLPSMASTSNLISRSGLVDHKQMLPPPVPSRATHPEEQNSTQNARLIESRGHRPQDITSYQQNRHIGSSHPSIQSLHGQDNAPYTPNRSTNSSAFAAGQSGSEPQTPRRFVPSLHASNPPQRSVPGTSTIPEFAPPGAKVGTNTHVNGRAVPLTSDGQRQRRFVPATPSGRSTAQGFQRQAFHPLDQNR